MVTRTSWTSLRRPGKETAALAQTEEGWRLTGHADLRFPEGPTTFRYVIRCNERWEPATAEIDLRTAFEQRRIEIEVDADHGWKLGGFRNPDLRGCTDLDFAASPATNTLTLNRLALPIGGRAQIRTAYVMFPDVVPIAVEQRYTRLGERRYFYEGLHNGFEREFEVDAHGWVTHYPEGWERERTASGASVRRGRRRRR